MLPKLNVIIGADTRQLEKGLNSAQATLSKFAKRAGIAAAAATTAFLTAGIKLSIDLDRALSETSTLLNGTAEEMDELRASAFDLAEAFGGGATRQVEAFYQALSAGVGGVTEATELLQVANLLAKGGVTDITTSVDILTSAMNAYAASGLTSAEASDILFTGVKDGKTTVEELARSLGNVIPIASSVGVGFDEIVAATAALTTQGQSTSIAVTGIRQTLAAILKPTAEAAKLAKELGLEFNTTALNAKGLGGFLEEVTEKTGGNQEQIAQLFGSVEALNAVLAFTGGAGAAFSDSMENMAESAGATQVAADKVADSLSDRLNVQLGLLKVAATKVGGALLTVIVPALEALTEFIQKAIVAFGSLAEMTRNAGIVLKYELDLIKQKFTSLVDFLAALPAKMMEIGSNIIQGLLDGITAKWGELKAKISELANLLPEWMKDILDIHSPSRIFAEIGENLMSGLVKGIGDKSGTVMQALQGVAGTMQSAMTSGFMSMIDGTKTVAGAFKDMAKSIIAKLYEVLVVQQIVGGFNASTGAGTGLVGMAMKAFSSFEGGGFTGNGSRTGGLDGKGGQLAIVHPRETIIDHTKSGGQQMGGGGTVIVNQEINVTTGVQATVRAEIVSLMPRISESAKLAVLDARKRGGAFAGAF